MSEKTTKPLIARILKNPITILTAIVLAITLGILSQERIWGS
jgi:uncharacterized phage infection (PIP) family protein YhgE